MQTWSGSDAVAASAGRTIPVQSGRAMTLSWWQADAGSRSRLTCCWAVVTVPTTCTSTTRGAASLLANVRASTKQVVKSFHLEELCDATAPYGRPVEFYVLISAELANNKLSCRREAARAQAARRSMLLKIYLTVT